MRLLVATRSAHKMKEIREILADIPNLELLDLDDAGVTYSPEEEDLEPYDTFEENATSKAKYFRRRSGLPTVADDSGLEVDYLDGAPGVRTKRFAPGDDLEGEARDQANNQFLLTRLSGVTESERGAQYVCVAALVWDPEKVETFRGDAPGVVLEAGRGGGGFGYDPIILDESSGKSFAELTADEKNSRSHRGRAFRAMGKALKEATGIRWEHSKGKGMTKDQMTPEHIGPTEDGAALEIRWKDGHHSVYEPRYLRLNCPCAGCVDEMTGQRTLTPSMVPEGIYPGAINYVGRYALQFVWSDGHDTGFFSFQTLRSLCTCQECKKA